jgi:hypothetical protein
LAANFYPEKAELSNDQDYDGKPDGMADPLAMLALGLIVALSMGFVFSPVVGDRLLFACWEPSKLSSLWLGVLEQPG